MGLNYSTLCPSYHDSIPILIKMNTPNFDNRFIRELPADPLEGPHVRQVPRACWSRVQPTPVREPRLLAFSAEMAQQLGFDEDFIHSAGFAQVFGGNALLPGMQPWAARYGGHQFGHWAGQLGDGRAISLGELITPSGERQELQLKGAGPTPYSRRADGRAVLRSSLREFLCSEAMHHLGVPTTRALSLVTTGEAVIRDMFYDGHARPEPGAVVCRVSPSFIRFGNFEIHAAMNELDVLEQLIDFTISRDFPHLHGAPETRRADWFREVCERTGRLMAHWMRVGFVHGVMNTDNMSIMGLTIDYGPYGWVDNFDPDWTPNTTDAQGRRYRFGAQPHIAHWNLLQLANALYTVIDDEAALRAALDAYVQHYETSSREMNAAKLGLSTLEDDDVDSLSRLQALLTRGEIDMTLFFRALARLDTDAPNLATFDSAFYTDENRRKVEADLHDWLKAYAARSQRDPLPRTEQIRRMNAANPCYVPRNYLAQQAIDKAGQGDASELLTLLDVLRRPYEEQAGREAYAARRPDWARHKAGCSMLSCSS